MDGLSGFFHGQLFIGVACFGLGLATCEDFHFAKRAKDELNDALCSLGSAAFIIVAKIKSVA